MQSESEEAGQIAALIAAPLAALGFELVRVVLSGRHRRRLEVMIERVGGSSVNLDDCALASRSISALLDVEDPIAGAYDLEVGSPGIDRPLTRAQDFERFVDAPVRIELTAPQDGRKRFKGRLLGLAPGGASARIKDDGQVIDLPLARIARARLAMSDALGPQPKPSGKRRMRANEDA
jgi:ribosome maturation factor RimP